MQHYNGIVKAHNRYVKKIELINDKIKIFLVLFSFLYIE